MAVREIARRKGLKVDDLVHEAVSDLIQKYSQGKPRAHVMTVHRANMVRYAAVYKKLAE